MKTFKLNAITRIILLPLLVVPASNALHASDLEIYKANTGGTATIMMMLDTSGSMGYGVGYQSYNFFGWYTGSGSMSIQEDYGVCDGEAGFKTVKNSFVASGTTPDYNRYYCPVTASAASNKVKDVATGCEPQKNSQGVIASYRCFDRLTRLKDALFKLMDDVSLKDTSIGLGNYSANGDAKSGQVLVVAKPLEGLSSNQRSKIKTKAAALAADSGTPSAHAYAEAAAYLLGNATTNITRSNNGNNYDNPNSGMQYAINNVEIINSSNKYISPLSQAEKSCNGQGIYFLTDGFPNGSSSSDATTIMKSSLGNSGNAFSCSVTTSQFPNPKDNRGNDLTSGAWQCIASFAKTLNDPVNNSFGQPIKTAVVGFGSDLAGVPKNADGTYNCNAASNNDAKNACNWGKKGAGYGEGGFYLGSNADDVVDSIKKFVTDVTPPFEPANIGTISIPRDPLDTTKALNIGFFPMIQPLADTNHRTWLGNLKKYYVLNGTLADGETTGNNLYKIVGSEQIINKSAKDLWTQGTASDYSPIRVGGAWNKIPVPSTATSTLDPISNINSNRNVYAVLGTTLFKATKDNLATDIAPATNQIGGNNTSFTVKQRIALLNYLGYSKPIADPTITKVDVNASTSSLPVVPYRFLGGVVHSTPLVVTKKAVIKSTLSNGVIQESEARGKEEYVVYGSMEGGLHIVDAETGKEQSVFIPAEILVNQPETLASPDEVGGLAYGVDAPWVADNSFKSVSAKSGTTTTTTYTALTMNVYGGLRMGGTGIYGLNISDPTNPDLLFRKTPNDSGFERMGQIWSKPVVAYIRVNKVKTKVLIFAGGYDDLYETTYKSSNPTGSIVTKGNAVYIVNAENGNLIWSTSSSATAGKNLQNTDMKYSIVGQPAVRDYNADGLVDAIWAADLGGQVFRIDLDNSTQITSTFSAIRTATLAKLDSKLRFYERPTTAVFDEGQNRFILVTVGSGNRSFPLEKDNSINKVYGLIDKDAVADDLEKSSFTKSPVIVESELVVSGVLGKLNTKQNSAADITSLKNYTKDLTTGALKKGWAFSLKSTGDDGFAKAFEEPQLISGDLYLSIYDPKAKLSGVSTSSCIGGVQGISTIYRVCMPYGDCAAYSTSDNTGIIGVPLGPVDKDKKRVTRIITPNPWDKEKCIGACGVNNPQLADGKGFQYTQGRSIRPIRWFEW